MALIIPGKTECSLCGNIIAEGDDIVATTHFIGDESDPLWGFSDSAMHRECFLRWELRQAFVDRYNATMGGIAWGNGSRQSMLPDGEIESTPPDPALAARFETELAEMSRPAAEELARRPPPPPCPYCGKPLRTSQARQCLSCGMDWHDPARVVRRGEGN